MDRPAPFTSEKFQKRLITFLPYQKAWLEDKSRFKIGNMSRQAGKSFATAAEIVEDCIDHERDGKKTHWVVLSRGERQALEYMHKNIIPMVKAFYILYSAILKNQTPPEIKESEYVVDRVAASGTTEQVRYKSFEVTLPGGSRITALPANPDTAVGYSANVLLDEFALHADSKAIWTALYPTITRGYKIRVISTPRGKNNKFYELMTDDASVWSKHRVTIHDAVAQGLDIDIDELKAGLNDDEVWAQEFELEWAEGSATALLWEDIIACEREGAGDPDGFLGGDVYVGNDIAGKGNDLWVTIPLEDVEGVLWLREILTRRKASFSEQDRLLDAVMERYRANRVGMDETGLGAKPVEDAEGRYGASRVTGVVFTQSIKHDMVQLLQTVFQDRTIALPVGDAKLRTDLYSIKKTVGNNGQPSYNAPTGGESHGDRFWALALAVFVAKGGKAIYAYHSASKTVEIRGAGPRRRVRTSSGLSNIKGAY